MLPTNLNITLRAVHADEVTAAELAAVNGTHLTNLLRFYGGSWLTLTKDLWHGLFTRHSLNDMAMLFKRVKKRAADKPHLTGRAIELLLAYATALRPYTGDNAVNEIFIECRKAALEIAGIVGLKREHRDAWKLFDSPLQHHEGHEAVVFMESIEPDFEDSCFPDLCEGDRFSLSPIMPRSPHIFIHGLGSKLGALEMSSEPSGTGIMRKQELDSTLTGNEARIPSGWARRLTKGTGNCLFHALHPDVIRNGYIECCTADKYRRFLADSIKPVFESANRSDVQPLLANFLNEAWECVAGSRPVSGSDALKRIIQNNNVIRALIKAYDDDAKGEQNHALKSENAKARCIKAIKSYLAGGGLTRFGQAINDERTRLGYKVGKPDHDRLLADVVSVIVNDAESDLGKAYRKTCEKFRLLEDLSIRDTLKQLRKKRTAVRTFFERLSSLDDQDFLAVASELPTFYARDGVYMSMDWMPFLARILLMNITVYQRGKAPEIFFGGANVGRKPHIFFDPATLHFEAVLTDSAYRHLKKA
jgi:hypothetical protein